MCIRPETPMNTYTNLVNTVSPNSLATTSIPKAPIKPKFTAANRIKNVVTLYIVVLIYPPWIVDKFIIPKNNAESKGIRGFHAAMQYKMLQCSIAENGGFSPSHKQFKNWLTY